MFDRGPQNLIVSGIGEPPHSSNLVSAREFRADRERNRRATSLDQSTQIEAHDRLVVGVDGTDESQHALDWTAHIARRVGAGIELVHASSPWVGLELALPPLDYDGYRAAVARSVDGWAERLTDVDHHSTVIEDDAAHAILSVASEMHSALIVLGSHPDGRLAPRMLGSTTSKVLDEAEAPVAIVPKGCSRRPDGRRIVVGVDGSDSSTSALRWAAGWATELRLGVYAVCVLPVGSHHEAPRLFDGNGAPSEGETLAALRDLAARMAHESGVDITSDVLIGHPGVQLVDAARDADMLAVGSSRHSMLHSLAFGSTSRMCITRSTAPVVVVP